MPSAPYSRTEKLSRAWTIAASANLLAAASHGLAGGHLPHPVLLGISTALSALICLGLLGRRLPRIGLASSVLTSQALMHLLFAHSGGVAHIPAEHLHHQSLGLQTQTLEHTAHQGNTAPMLVLHLLAAITTYLLIRFGELALERTALALEKLVIWVVKLPRLGSIHLPQRLQIPARRRPEFSLQTFLLTVRALRGPPPALHTQNL